MKGVLDKHVAGVSVKWPNDLYIGERKACGILIENNLLGPVVSESIIGTGLNLNQRTFAAEAAPLAVSLAQATGQTFEREAILQDFCAQFKHFYQMAKKEPETLHANYMQSLYRREGLQAWHSEAEGDFRARIRTVDGFGRLLLEKEDGRLSAYAFKEVSYRFACE
jgi:BirA family biotin operon repressor/biotin-[acetyl-CoA-carboxylase] ligase